MTTGDATRWDARYADREATTAAALPDALAASGLIGLVPTSGRALDVACGLGAQSLWLAQHGLDVTAIDVSSEAVARIDEARASLDGGDRIDVRVADLDSGLPGNDTYDVIVCQRFRAPDLYAAFVERLAIGGISVVTVLSAAGAEQPGEFHAPPGELERAFDRPDVDVLFASEADGESSVIIRRTT